jgi:hypothetical protein
MARLVPGDRRDPEAPQIAGWNTGRTLELSGGRRDAHRHELYGNWVVDRRPPADRRNTRRNTLRRVVTVEVFDRNRSRARVDWS